MIGTVAHVSALGWCPFKRMCLRQHILSPIYYHYYYYSYYYYYQHTITTITTTITSITDFTTIPTISYYYRAHLRALG